jgi:hypothetical protein
MASESFKLNTWVKLARKKRIPYFEPPVVLDPGPLESINCEALPLLEVEPEVDPFDAEIKKFGRYWDDRFRWDLASRNVAEVKMKVEDPNTPSKEKFRIWREALKGEFGSIIRARIGKEMEACYLQSQRDEWDHTIIANLAASRRKDRYCDIKMAWLTVYNEEIDDEESMRRLKSLNPEVANKVFAVFCFETQVPRPLSWHMDKDSNDFIETGCTDEEWDSAVKNRPIARAAIRHIPELHLHRRQLMAPEFWKQQRLNWSSAYVKELEVFKKNRAWAGNMRSARAVFTSLMKESRALMKHAPFT